MSSNYDIMKLFENIVDEVVKSYDEIEGDLEGYASKIKSRGLEAPNSSSNKKNKSNDTKSKKSKKDQILSKKNNEEEDNVEVPDNLQPDFSEEEDTSDPSSISLEQAHVFTDFVDNLNRFRAAGSLKDSDVNNQLKIYFKLLTPGERQAIYVFFKGLVQIADLVKGNDSGKNADRPSTSGIKISTGSSSNNNEKDSEEKSIEKDNLENTKDDVEAKKKDQYRKKKNVTKTKSSSNPITVKSINSSVQDKTEILKVIKEVNSI